MLTVQVEAAQVQLRPPTALCACLALLSSASGNLVAGHVPLLGACGEAPGAVQAFTKVGAVPEEAAAVANDVLCMR